VTNVEGVLDRIAQAIKLAIKDGDGTETENGRVLLEKIDSIKAGGLPVTMILQDPMGNSVLVFGQGQKNCVCAGRAGCVRGLKGPEFF
jgi:zinc finger protein